MLAGIGVWGVVEIVGMREVDSAQLPSDNDQYRQSTSHHEPRMFGPNQKSLDQQIVQSIEPPIASPKELPKQPPQITAHLSHIQALLAKSLPHEAAQYIEGIYSDISSQDLASISRLYWTQARNYSQPANNERLKQLYLVAGKLFDDIEFWDGAAQVAASQKDWTVALEALRRSTALENRPELLEKKLLVLVRYASQLRAQHEALGDELGVRALYQELYREHPNYPRFQLELAQSYLRSGDSKAALPLLKQLQYDPELGAIAKLKLANLEKQAASQPIQPAPAKDLDRRANDIVVPLRRLGNSFLVSGSVNGVNLTLLLDTGASITAISKDLIKRLKLEATGQVINLSTANGLTTSRLFRVDKLRLGRLYVEDSVVAEIDLGGSREFQALLGTDLLNQADPRYSYVIDNTKNALIFRWR